MNSLPRIQILSPYHFEIHWPSKICSSILQDMMACKTSLLESLGNQSFQLTMGYHVLAVFFERPGRINNRVKLLERALEERKVNPRLKSKRWKIPVCYDTALAQDLDTFCLKKGLDIDQFVHLHSSPRYLLHFYGFLPGFMYLGGLEKRLYQPRKENPDSKIPAGSVAIGGMQTGIYPIESPGGWYVVGRCPIELIGKDELPPFEPGDEICFTPILLEEFEALKFQPAKSLLHEFI